MNIVFNFKNIGASDTIKQHAVSRFERLSKYVGNDDNLEVQVNLSVEKQRQIAEVVVSGDDLHLSAYQDSEDIYGSIDLVLDKVVAQLKRLREKSAVRRGRGAEQIVRQDVFSLPEGGEGVRTIIESDTYEPKPMDPDEAAMQLESLGYEFLVFINSENSRANVIYRRADGNFGLIDPGI